MGIWQGGFRIFHWVGGIFSVFTFLLLVPLRAFGCAFFFVGGRWGGGDAGGVQKM